MDGVRRGARAVLKYFAPLYLIAILVQVFLAGYGVFGIKDGQGLDDAKSLDAHRGLGFILAEPAAILFLIVALLAWLPDRKLRRVSIALPFLVFLQDPLAWFGRWSGGLHPLNAFLVLGLLGWLAHRLWRARAVAEGAPAVREG